jgi:ubiquinol-cytochrome c reductase iron-sulfur subunit
MLGRLVSRFGFIKEFNRRSAINVEGTHLFEPKSKFWVTPSRPGNFGEHVDLRVNIDNWFDENRVHNEEEPEIRRAQLYTLGAIYYGALLSFARLFAVAVIGRLNGFKRYDRDTYMEVDISELPPAEVLQITWNGSPVFIRRLTREECHHEDTLPTDTLLDKSGEIFLSDGGSSKILVCSAVCTHLGCIPIPYLGAFGGWVCICHGSVYDKYGRVRQGPALQNLPNINNTAYESGTLLCIEALNFPREPSEHFWI